MSGFFSSSVYVCRITKGVGMEQVLTQLEVKLLFDDSTDRNI